MAILYAMAVLDSSHAADCRRRVGSIARELHFDETCQGKIAIVVTEMATNLVKHARGGEILARPLIDDERNGLEILAIDRGPGIGDVGEAMRDGYSTAGSSGTGMGAVRRMSDQFDIYSTPAGTILMARFWTDGAPPTLPPLFEIEGVAVPKPGEESCGDDWTCHASGDELLVMVADGLGHGEMAAVASRQARLTFTENIGETSDLIMRQMHGMMRSTRGAAAAIARIDAGRGSIGYTGVGNIAGTVLSPEKVHRMISHNGIVGHEIRKVQEFTYPWSDESILVMHSDGLGTQWDLDAYPGLLSHHLSLVAGVLYRDFTRGRDDTTVVVARRRR